MSSNLVDSSCAARYNARMIFVLGLDAGGTKTSAVVLDAHKRECGRGVGGPGNYHSAGKEGALAAMQQAIGAALAQAQLDRAQISAACFALSGVSRPADKPAAELFAHTALPNVPVIVCNDAIAALYSGAGKAEGVVVIAGTGSIIYGFAPDGRQTRAGGWGYRLGDEGSGWWLAEQALFAITHAHDGRTPATLLTQKFLSQLNLHDPTDLITWAYSAAWTRDQVAALAPLVLEAAQAGDAAALRIVNGGVAALAQCVQIVTRKLEMHTRAFDVVLFGSLFRSALYEYAMRRALSEQCAHASPILPQADAAVGAAWLALDSLHKPPHDWLTG